MAAALEEVETALERSQCGAGRRQRALSKDRHGQTCRLGVVVGFAPDLGRVLREQSLQPPLYATDSDRDEAMPAHRQRTYVMPGTPEHQRGRLVGEPSDVRDRFEAPWI